jgi:hypothetical protein
VGLQSDPLAPALRASATPLNGFLMAAKAAYLAFAAPPRRDPKGPRGLGPPVNTANRKGIRPASSPEQ